ncbi:MAG TPA: DUF4197 domain-containing protein [Edaphocola sp.]|nr:DUF4197 domain-containing protein [Edaphocola sp.]
MKPNSMFRKAAAALFIFGLSAFFTAGTASAQSLNDLFGRLKKATAPGSANNSSSNGNSLSGLSNADISSGLKQALEIGARQASQQLSQKDGFFKNAAVKILMPPEAQKVAETLRSMGMGSLVDDAVLRMNRAAEDAAVKAAPIFINAIKGITIQDGVQILRGGNNAATLYLESKTSSALTAAFAPVIQQSLDKVGATRIWKSVFQAYNQVPFVQKVNPDLVSYVTQQALKGVFTEIAAEELKIRTNPASRVTSLLQKVFGSQ